MDPNQLLMVALAAAMVAIVFVTKSGQGLGSSTWTEIAVTVLGAAAVIAVLLFGAAGRPYGAVTLGLFALLAVLTALSIVWSVQPADSWLEANRALSYFAVFTAGAAIARLLPERWPMLLGAIALFTLVIAGYALLVKVFPETLARQETLGRLRAPLGYWNATGLIAAFGLPAWLWMGTRPDARVTRGIAPAGIAVLVTVVVLSYSRSAALAALAAVGIWFALAPVRLRGVLTLGIGLGGAAILSGWALATHAVTHDRVSLTLRSSAGHDFGIVVVVTLLLVFAVGLGAAFVSDRTVLTPESRRRLGIALIVTVALVPLAGVAVLATSQRGLTGQISHAWDSLTNTSNEYVSNQADRLVNLESSRGRDWNQAWLVFSHSPVHGVGALGYATARTRYGNDPYVVEHAHSYVFQTLADFGLLGLVANVALLIAWGWAARRSIRRPRRVDEGGTELGAHRPELQAERVGMITLLAGVVAFGVHSAIDWTWFIPGTAIPALLCAGWLAGRGPLDRRVGRREERAKLSMRPLVGLACTGVVAVTLLAGWLIWQPLRSDNAANAALDALTRGDTAAAFTDARAAAARNPLSVEPLWLLAALYSRIGDEHAAHAEFVKALSLQRENPATWQRLGLYDLQHGQPHKALGVLEHAEQLDHTSTVLPKAISQAQAALAAIKASHG